jgi:hypothetical protein
VAALVCFLLAASGLHAQRSSPGEYEVKAAYLYNFGKFVQWPSNAPADGNSFPICVLGRDPFGETLDSTTLGESINTKKIVIKRIASAQEAAGCRILFISSSEEGRLREILRALGSTSVLTVSELPHFTRDGGMVQFVMEANRVRFEVNLAVAESASLVLSSQLLKVATTVRRRAPSRG